MTLLARGLLATDCKAVASILNSLKYPHNPPVSESKEKGNKKNPWKNHLDISGHIESRCIFQLFCCVTPICCLRPAALAPPVRPTSALSGSGRAKHTLRFIFAGSKRQLERPAPVEARPRGRARLVRGVWQRSGISKRAV